MLLSYNNTEEEDKLQRQKEITRIGRALEEETVDSGLVLHRLG